MKQIKQLIMLIMLSNLVIGCATVASSSSSAPINVVTYSPVYPVLIGKEYNPVLRINLSAAKRLDQELTNVTLDFSGTDDLSDIKSVKLFYSAGVEHFKAKTLLGRTSKISTLTTIEINKPLVPAQGNNYLWLTVNLKDDANTLHDIAVNFKELELSNQTIVASATSQAPHNRIGHALRNAKDDGVHTYRIPGLATTNQGSLIAVYDVRHKNRHDLQGDIDIGMSRSIDGGQSWQAMKIIMDMGEWGGLPQDQNGIGDPSILVDRQTGTIWVAGLWAHGHPGKTAWGASKPGLTPAKTSQLMLSKSDDDGLTWSAPINITAQVKDPKWHLLLEGPGKGISLKDGTLVFPAQYKDENNLPSATLISSKDHGKTWTIGTSAKTDTTEAQVVELSDGSIMLNMRDNRGAGPGRQNGSGTRAIMTSTDLGMNWLEHPTSDLALPESVCNASLISHSVANEQSLLLFANPADQYARRNMTIKVSQDQGMSWPEQHFTLIDEGTGWGYPSLTSIDQQTVGILYESSQAQLVFQRFKLSELMAK